MKKIGYKSAAQRRKNLRYGGYATVVSLIVLVVLIVLTVLFEQLDLTVDLSNNKMYTPSDQTMKVLNSLDDDIELYGLYSTGTETKTYYAEVLRLMEQYARICDKVTYETIDTLKNPTFVKEYISDDSSVSTVADGSVIIKNTATGKYRLLGIMDFYSYTDTSTTIDEFCAEEALTTAIQYVSSDRTPVLYQLQGHGETELDSTFESYMRTTNYDFETLNLAELTTDEIEVNIYSSLLINNPQTDLSDDEYELLLSYLERGGHMLIMLDYEVPNTLTNLSRLLARYGLSYEAGGEYVQETAYSNYAGYDYIILPKIAESHDITSNLDSNNNYIRMLHAVPIFVADQSELLRNIEITTLLTSSDTARLVNSENEDETGKFALAVAVEETKTSTDMNNVLQTRLVVIGNSSFINASNNYRTNGNYQMLAATLDYLQDEVSNVYITSKNLSAGTISVSMADFIGGFAAFVIVLPLVIMIAGVVIWVRRRHL
jgi:hypothetical protein